MSTRPAYSPWTLVACAAAVLAIAALYALTLQTQISGSFAEQSPELVLKNEYIKDVAEIQVALNTWGTIHHTGYPLYAILGNLTTRPLRALGLTPAAAASLYATAWAAIALAALAALLARLTGRPWLAVACLLPLAAARSIWIHAVIAEVYSMSLAITALLLAIALWPAARDDPGALRRRVLWLALLGGIGVAHHRAVLFVAPGLIAAVWPALRTDRAGLRRLLIRGAGLFALGFVPYAYLPLRAWQDAPWVYGEPGTLRGLWIEFSGREAARLVTLPASWAALQDNVVSVGEILVHELTLPGLLVGALGVLLALIAAPQRRAARILALSAAGPLLFAIVYHTAVLPQAILMPVVLAIVACSALALEGLLRRVPRAALPAAILLAAWGGALAVWGYPYVRELVREPSGVQMIARLARMPQDGRSALMLPWGPRYAAASYARLVLGDYPGLRVIDHKADYAALRSQGYRLYTEPETFYTYPPPWPTAFTDPSPWWPEHFGPLYLTSAQPGLIELLSAPQIATPGETPGTPILAGIGRRAAWLSCDAEHLYVHVIWDADTRPARDPSIFVHLTGDEPAPNPPNADQRHPVYGFYPFAQWSPGEIVRDDFTLPRLPDKSQVRLGLYEPAADGQFVNYGELILPVAECQPVP